MVKKTIGITGPSTFTQDVINLVEKFLECNFVLLYHNQEDNLKYWSNEIDGLILAGGIDVHPSLYMDYVPTGKNISKLDIKRDIRELKVYEECIKRKLPILGICRGHQLIGLANKLPFTPDISGSAVAHRPSSAELEDIGPLESLHSVYFIEENYSKEISKINMGHCDIISKKYSVRYENQFWVNSFHHQALLAPTNEKGEVTRSLDKIEILAVAQILGYEQDTIIECMESKEGNWLSCQWHPEFDWEQNSVSKWIVNKFKKMLK